MAFPRAWRFWRGRWGKLNEPRNAQIGTDVFGEAKAFGFRYGRHWEAGMKRISRVLPAAMLFATLTLVMSGQAVAQGAGSNPGPGSFVEVEGSKLYFEECGTGSE